MLLKHKKTLFVGLINIFILILFVIIKLKQLTICNENCKDNKNVEKWVFVKFEKRKKLEIK